jgi:hypothetical protein
MGLWTKRLTQLSLVAFAAALPLSRQSPLSAQTSPVEARSNHTALVTAVRGVDLLEYLSPHALLATEPSLRE